MAWFPVTMVVDICCCGKGWYRWVGLVCLEELFLLGEVSVLLACQYCWVVCMVGVGAMNYISMGLACWSGWSVGGSSNCAVLV